MPENTDFSTNKKSSDTKERILEVSLDLFSQKGYKGASVRMISSAAGIRESAIYNHFKNKEHILEEMIKQISLPSFPLIREDRPFRDMALGGKKFLMEFATNFKLVSFDKRNEKFFKFMIIEMMQVQKVREDFLDNFLKHYLKKLSEAFFFMMQDDMVRSCDPMLMSQEFLSPLFFYRLQLSMLRIDDKNTSDITTLFEKHVDFFWENISLK